MRLTKKKIRKILALATILIYVLISFPLSLDGKNNIYGAITNDIKIVRVYDGDTFYINIKGYPAILGENIGIRINGIDTPEIRTRNKSEKKMGYKAKNVLYNLLHSAKRIELRNIQRGKYFRIVADVYVDGKNVKEIMISKKLAYEYHGGKKRKWSK